MLRLFVLGKEGLVVPVTPGLADPVVAPPGPGLDVGPALNPGEPRIAGLKGVVPRAHGMGDELIIGGTAKTFLANGVGRK